MKTTKDIAELFSAEIERISKGDVRHDVIQGLERCSNSLIKLARLEMDFACNWENQKPNVPWLSTQPTNGNGHAKSIEDAPKASPNLKVEKLEQQIAETKEKLKTATGTMKTILQDKLEGLIAKEIDYDRMDKMQANSPG